MTEAQKQDFINKHTDMRDRFTSAVVQGVGQLLQGMHDKKGDAEAIKVLIHDFAEDLTLKAYGPAIESISDPVFDRMAVKVPLEDEQGNSVGPN